MLPLKEMLQILKSSNLDKSEIKTAEKSLKKDFPNGIDALGLIHYVVLASYLKKVADQHRYTASCYSQAIL